MTNKRVALVFGGLGVLFVALVVANLCMGSLSVPLSELAGVLLGMGEGGTSVQVIWSIRLPRLVAAGLLGGALALSGVLLQAFFNNPLAGPFVLGISSGAKLAVAVVMVVLVGATGVMASWMSVLAAFVGSLAIMLAMLLVSRRVRSSSTLVVAGIMLGYICNALTDFLVNFASDASIVSLRNWSMGSFSGTNWDDVRVIVVVVAGASLCAFALSKSLGAYLLGEDYASSVGVNVRAFRIAVIALSSLLAACVTAFAGPISFAGIAVPHLTKRLLHTSKPLLVVPAAFLGGACFCLFCDLVARTLFTPTEMSVSSVTAVLGAPVVIWMLLERKQRPAVRHARTGSVRSGDGPLGASAGKRRAEGASERPSASGILAHQVLVEGRTAGASASSAVTEPSQAVSKAVQTDADGEVLSSMCCPCLWASGLAVGYGTEQVVAGVDLKVCPGQLVTLIGPNGVGKSTILRSVAGLQESLQGEVALCGVDLSELSARDRARTCAVLLTERPHTEFLTCEDVVEAGRYPHTGRMGLLGDEDRAQVRRAMELMEVWDLRDRDYMQLSDGQRQRVMLARALCQEPRLLVLDEPTSFLDVRYQIELFSVLRGLVRERPLGILMSLHDVVLARQVSDWVVCVKDGDAPYQGRPDDIFVPEVIDELYDLRPGMYDSVSGVVKLHVISDKQGRGTA